MRHNVVEYFSRAPPVLPVITPTWAIVLMVFLSLGVVASLGIAMYFARKQAKQAAHHPVRLYFGLLGFDVY